VLPGHEPAARAGRPVRSRGSRAVAPNGTPAGSRRLRGYCCGGRWPTALASRLSHEFVELAVAGRHDRWLSLGCHWQHASIRFGAEVAVEPCHRQTFSVDFVISVTGEPEPV
jgi:hypothetical protein